MRVAILFSGGKDSVFATFWAITQGFEIVLVTVKPPEYSMMFHHPNVDATKMQAEAIGLEQVFVETTEENWRDKLLGALKGLKVDGIVTGAIESEYQKRRIDSIGDELGVPTYAPLWHKNKQDLMNEMLENFEIYVTAVSAEGLGPEFLGEPFSKLVNANIKNIHPLLEGGEGETFVTYAPFFKKRIKIKKWKKTWDGIRGVAEIENAELVVI
ncbi:diphthine--ammonia ligase [Candidatus Micrarchaeota archaeon]|nr:diphthine--ammonia ligase [Candidatus Micrarchaeota archaeon]MBU1166337.1 diphthine--ammonia ligase [Candidatus Micrarchaeota archaeon]MBU1886411.1 diphthine--ammonia ligase [Candidatus Micrarchaeota archaeon]